MFEGEVELFINFFEYMNGRCNNTIPKSLISRPLSYEFETVYIRTEA